MLRCGMKRSNLKKVHTTFRLTAFVKPSARGERASRGLFCLGGARGNEHRANEGQNFCQLEIRRVTSWSWPQMRRVWGVVDHRAHSSGIWKGMVTGLGTQGWVFSAQISPAALYPGICPHLKTWYLRWILNMANLTNWSQKQLCWSFWQLGAFVMWRPFQKPLPGFGSSGKQFRGTQMGTEIAR